MNIQTWDVRTKHFRKPHWSTNAFNDQNAQCHYGTDAYDEEIALHVDESENASEESRVCGSRQRSRPVLLLPSFNNSAFHQFHDPTKHTCFRLRGKHSAKLRWPTALNSSYLHIDLRIVVVKYRYFYFRVIGHLKWNVCTRCSLVLLMRS